MRAGALRAALGEGMLELLFPSGVNCMGCGDPLGAWAGWLCPSCAEALVPLSRLSRARCPRCGRPDKLGPKCRLCGQWPRDILSFARFAYFYGRPVKGMIRRMKYGGVRVMGDWMGEQLSNLMLTELFDEPDVLVPVPMHRLRRLERGFNHAETLATALGERIRVPVMRDALVRVRNTRQQARLGGDARRRGLQGAFEAAGVEGLRVLLVDDVITTGSTALECACALRKAGAREVQVIALAGAR